jgi:predicted transposase YbfD/YdcC
VEKGHGREEKRTLRTTSALTVAQKWSGLQQAFELCRERRIGNETSLEIVYGITSLSPAKAGAAELLGIIRDHWKIENQLHYVRDVTLREDACRVRTGAAPQVLAAFRNAIVHLLSSVQAISRPAAIECLQIDPTQAMKLIGIPQRE